MNILAVLLISFVIFVFIFFLSSISHRIGYVVLLAWFFIGFGSRSNSDKINNFLNQYYMLNTIYIMLFIALLLYCLIGVIEALITIFVGEFTFWKYFRKKYRSNKEIKKLEAQGRRPGQLDLYTLFPQIKELNEYEYIFNQCRNKDEKEQFLEDWNRYLIDLQSYAFLELNENSEQKMDSLFFSFDEWYKMNEIWKTSDYYHAYYEEQYNERKRADKRVQNKDNASKIENNIPSSIKVTLPSEDLQYEDLVNELNGMIGLNNVKKEIGNLIQLEKYQLLREKQGLKRNNGNGTNHLVFAGNPGTGKTTVARMLANIYKELGIISKGQLVEVDRSGLVGQYVGQTAQIVHSVIQEAIGGVLFIDEAYSLYHSGLVSGDTYGQEAIDVLLKEMEDNRDNLVVIVAGYTDKMEEFLTRNPGLKSRFKATIYFDDYYPEEMLLLYKEYCCKDDNVLSIEAELKMRTILNKIYNEKSDNFGNGRTIRNIYNATIEQMGKRLAYADNPSVDELRTILSEDLNFNYKMYL